MALPATRLPPHLLPRSKAAATSSSTTSLDALANTTTTTTPPQPSRSSSGHRAASPLIPTDVSDRATAALVRRVLCPLSHGGLLAESRPLDELLPPLTSSNEVDLQLYAIIAVVVKDFVASWYGKITPDQSFVEEAVRIVAHCTRELEQRLRRADLEALLLDEVPALVERHVHAYRTACHPIHAPPIAPDPRTLYHAQLPHPGLSPVPDADDPSTAREQAENEAAYRQLLVQGVLAVLLPTEDLQNPCLRILVGDVFGEMVLGKGIGGKACEGWVIWEAISKIVAGVKAQIEFRQTGQEIEADTRSRLEKFGLLSGGKNGARSVGEPGAGRSSVISEFFWRLVQYGYLTFATTRFIVVGLMAASTASPRRRPPPKPAGSKGQYISPMAAGVEAPAAAGRRPILAYSVFGLVSQLLDLGWRMPWVVGTLSLAQWHLVGGALRVGATDGLLDK